MRQNTSIPTWLPARPLKLLKTVKKQAGTCISCELTKDY
jgi:hypothetical protein